MDPEATLELARQAIEEWKFDEAREALLDYWEWRHSGGFEPPQGDERAKAYGFLVRRGQRT